MKNNIRSSIASAIIGLTAFLSPAWAEPGASAERAIRLNIPVRVEGDLSRVTDGIWLHCFGEVNQDYSYRTKWTAEITPPGATFAPNADDGTFIATFEFVPSDLGPDITTRFERAYTIVIVCNLQRGEFIPADQSTPEDIRRTERIDSYGYPTSPAGPGSCGVTQIIIRVRVPDHFDLDAVRAINCI